MPPPVTAEPANRNFTRSIAWTYHVTSRCIEIDITGKRDLVGTYTQSVLYRSWCSPASMQLEELFH